MYLPVFSPALCCRETPLPQATRRAVEFIRVCAERTAAQDLPMREGVDFEPLLGLLTGGKPIA